MALIQCDVRRGDGDTDTHGDGVHVANGPQEEPAPPAPGSLTPASRTPRQCRSVVGGAGPWGFVTAAPVKEDTRVLPAAHGAPHPEGLLPQAPGGDSSLTRRPARGTENRIVLNKGAGPPPSFRSLTLPQGLHPPRGHSLFCSERSRMGRVFHGGQDCQTGRVHRLHGL